MKVPKPILNKLASIATCEGSHYAINGIYFTRKGKRCAAEVTDGRMLVRVEWNDDSKKKKDFATILSAESIKLSQNGNGLSVELRESDSAILDNQDIETVDGKFPKTKDVIPDYELDKCHVFKVDPARLAKLLDALANVVPLNDPPCVEIICPLDAKKPVRMNLQTKDSSVSVLAVLMPIRSGPQYPADGD